MINTKYRLDRTKFKMQTFQQADNQVPYWKTRTVEERLSAALYLMSVAFQFDLENPPKLDRTVFSMRKRSNNE